MPGDLCTAPRIISLPPLSLATDVTDVFSLIPSFSLSDVLCDPTDVIWSKGTPFEAMTGRTAPSPDGLLPEVFRGFPQFKANARGSEHSPWDHFIIILTISDRLD